MLVVPIHYLWRPYQIVIWNWDRRRNRKHAPKPKKQPKPVKDEVPVGEPVTVR